MTELLDGVPERVLAVYAHPDDPDVSCGGTLARWAGAGAEVHVLICTDGDKGTTDPDVDPVVLADRRAEEAAEAAAIVGRRRASTSSDTPTASSSTTRPCGPPW